MDYSFKGALLSYEAKGDSMWGQHKVLLHGADDLTRNTRWHADGFGIEQLFDTTVRFNNFIDEATNLLIERWRRSGLPIDSDFNISKYHHAVQDWNTHLKALEETKLLSVAEFPVNIRLIEERISAICGVHVEVRNPFDDQRIFHFRVVRPRQKDNNPLHRDVWLDDYSNCINLYIPVAGSNELSSLILVRGSHLWPESRVQRTVTGAMINGVQFNVPAVTEIAGEFEVVRPTPLENQVLIFSPYMIHGGAVNLNEDLTRISIELRLWKRQ